jgi:hypothetical protein
VFSDLQGNPSLVHGPNSVRGQAQLAGETGAGRGGKLKVAYAEASRKMQRANEVVDDLARSAMYLSQRRKGMSSEAALQKAYTALVDYGDLSPFERQVVRSIVPFYAWQKGIFKIVSQPPARQAKRRPPGADAGLVRLDGRGSRHQHEDQHEVIQPVR